MPQFAYLQSGDNSSCLWLVQNWVDILDQSLSSKHADVCRYVFFCFYLYYYNFSPSWLDYELLEDRGHVLLVFTSQVPAITPFKHWAPGKCCWINGPLFCPRKKTRTAVCRNHRWWCHALKSEKYRFLYIFYSYFLFFYLFKLS